MSKKIYFGSFLALALAAAVVRPLSCTNDIIDVKEPRAEATLTQGELDVSPAGSAVESAPEPTDRDRQIAALLLAFNRTAARESSVAATSVESQLRDFAARLGAEHLAATEREEALLRSLTLSTKVSARSLVLERASDTAISELKALSSSDLDRAYLARVVTTRKEALSLIEDDLLPAVLRPEMKDELAIVRRTMEAELAFAQNLELYLGYRAFQGQRDPATSSGP